MRVLVCGGRNGYAKVGETLDRLKDIIPITHIITGGARGVDSQAMQWAIGAEISLETFMADWKTNGKAAGPIRNQLMLDKGNVEFAIAFPGGNGTKDMIKRIEKHKETNPKFGYLIIHV